MKRTILAIVAVTLILSGTDAVFAGTSSINKVKGVKAKTTASEVQLTWQRQKSATGYEVTCGNRKLETTACYAAFSGLKQGEEYCCTVKAFKKTRQYFNKKTKKWQKKKPRKKYRKGTRLKKVYGKAASVYTTTAVYAAEAPSPGTVSITVVSDQPLANVPIKLESESCTYRFVTNDRGQIQAKAKAGTYMIRGYDTDEYVFPDDQKIQIRSGKETTLIVDCEAKPSFLDVIVKAEEEMPVCVTIEGKEELLSVETVLREGYNYPLDTCVPKGIYTVTITGDAWCESQVVYVEQNGGVYSAYFDL